MAGKFANLAVSVEATNRAAVARIADDGKEIMLRGAVAAGLRRGGTLPSHGSARWGARYDLKGTRNPSALLRYTGPVHWALGGTSPHVIGARGRGTRRSWQRRYAVEQTNALLGLQGAKGSRARSLGSGRYGTRSKGAKALRFGGRFATYARHPGHRGRNTWPATKALVARNGQATFARMHRQNITSIFQ